MYDTVVAYANLTRRLYPDEFGGWRIIADQRGSVARYWIKPDEPHDPHITYYRAGGEDIPDGDGRLMVEFSVPQVAALDQRSNVDQYYRDRALDRVNNYIHKKLGRSIGDVRGWIVQRVDYTHNWSDVSPHMGLYLAALSGLHIGGMHKQSYPPDRGVMFKTISQRGRWVKFYNKSKLLGDGDPRETLRYEVSNLRDAAKYMAEHWFACERTVDAMLQPGRALYMLHLYWQRLGLSDGAIGGDDAALMHDLRAAFGRGSSTAYYILTLHRAYGAKCISMGLCSKNSYYAWRTKLSDGNYLADVPRPLPPLPLPTLNAVQTASHSDSELLAKSPEGVAVSAQKILWGKIAPRYGVAPTAPVVHALMEGCTFEQETDELGRVSEVVA